MSEPLFTQPDRRSYAVPILLALVFLSAAAAMGIHFFPATSIHAEHLQTQVLPTHTVFKSNSIVVGPAQTSDVLFVASTLRIDNKTRAPIFLDGFSCTFTDPAGAVLIEKALNKEDLPNIQTTFPALKPLLSSPLLRETSIAPGASLAGQVLFSYPFTKAQWDARKSASVQVDFYHLPPAVLDIPKP